MTNDELHRLLTAADPLPAERAAALDLGHARDALLAGVLSEPVRRRPSGSSRRRVRIRLALATAAAAVALLALLSLNGGSDDRGSNTAWAAEELRFAEASPLVLLDAPGWRVFYADEESQTDGELQYRRGPTRPPRVITPPTDGRPLPADTNAADLNWRGGGIAEWYRDRAASAVRTTTAPVLGTTARVYQYEGGTPGHRDITALFRYDGRVLEFRAGAADIGAFKVLLASLARVDTDTWLSAMPASVVKTRDRASTVRRMLQGVAVPPGFEAARIKGENLTKDRYQLGAAVTGTVACEWFARWADARADGDPAKEREAIAAMQTAKEWPVLRQMASQGGYPDVLLDYVKAMPSGDWYGRPLIGELDDGLGCDSLGVDLP
jgi:hypothetical protein